MEDGGLEEPHARTDHHLLLLVVISPAPLARGAGEKSARARVERNFQPPASRLG